MLLPLMKTNVGLIFSEEPYQELRKTIESQIISMPPRTGVVAPCDVFCPAGPTGIDVGKIDLFHKLNIGCKTVKSAIEVVKEVKIITKGEKVGEGATRLCKLLNIVPFDYKLEFLYVYKDGAILDQEALDTNPEDIIEKFKDYAGYLLAASLGSGLPNALSVPHFLANGFKSLLAIGAESGYEFKQLKDNEFKQVKGNECIDLLDSEDQCIHYLSLV
jgi:large subunit ribosomal protein LP0